MFMSALTSSLYPAAAIENFFRVNGDKRVAELRFMDNPWEVLSIATFYVYFCYDLGPHRLMRNRKPFNLVWTVRVFNTFILLLNVWLLKRHFLLLNWGYDSIGCSVSNLKILDHHHHHHHHDSSIVSQAANVSDIYSSLHLASFTSSSSSPSSPSSFVGNNHIHDQPRQQQQPVDDSESPKALEHINISHIFLYSRILELIDTLWICLRKKNRQITFLHVFHHSFVLLMTWFYFKMAPGGSSAMFPIVNGLVHTIMYTYYILSTFESVKPYLWWKKYVTTIQLVQFAILGLHFLVAALTPNCGYPRSLSLTGAAIAGMFFCLFFAFYKETYTPITLSATKQQQHQHQHKHKQHLKEELKKLS